MKKSIVAAVLSGVLAGGILVSAGSIMADTPDSSRETKSSVVEMKRGGGMRGHGDMGPGFMGKGQAGLETILDELVADGTITQAQADAILEKQQEKMEAQREEMTAKQKEMMQEKYAQLVEDGVISEEQADKMKEFQQTKVDERQAQMDELKDMTNAERKAFFEENKDKKKGIDMLDQMVGEGIISQDQADKLAEEMPMPGHFRQKNIDSLSERQE